MSKWKCLVLGLMLSILISSNQAYSASIELNSLYSGTNDLETAAHSSDSDVLTVSPKNDAYVTFGSYSINNNFDFNSINAASISLNIANGNYTGIKPILRSWGRVLVIDAFSNPVINNGTMSWNVDLSDVYNKTLLFDDNNDLTVWFFDQSINIESTSGGFGFTYYGDVITTPENTIDFYSSNYPDANLRPSMVLEYTPVPEPTTMLLGLLGLGGVIGVKRRKFN